MKKMPCLFQREFHGKGSFTLLDAVAPGCEWVLAGEGVATRKRDGAACMVKEGRLYKRYDAKRDRKTGAYKAIPPEALSCDEPDPVTGHWPNWVPVDGANPTDKYHVYALSAAIDESGLLADGTYELCGPAINGNPEGLLRHVFYRHGAEDLEFLGVPRTFNGLHDFLWPSGMEGIVFHHPDGRMCKIRRRDFGFEWGGKAATRAGG